MFPSSVLTVSRSIQCGLAPSGRDLRIEVLPRARVDADRGIVMGQERISLRFAR